MSRLGKCVCACVCVYISSREPRSFVLLPRRIRLRGELSCLFCISATHQGQIYKDNFKTKHTNQKFLQTPNLTLPVVLTRRPIGRTVSIIGNGVYDKFDCQGLTLIGRQQYLSLVPPSFRNLFMCMRDGETSLKYIY